MPPGSQLRSTIDPICQVGAGNKECRPLLCFRRTCHATCRNASDLDLCFGAWQQIQYHEHSKSEYFVNDKHIATKSKLKWPPKVPRSLSQQIELRQHLKSKFLGKIEIVYKWLATEKMAASMCVAICKQNSQVEIREYRIAKN